VDVHRHARLVHHHAEVVRDRDQTSNRAGLEQPPLRDPRGGVLAPAHQVPQPVDAPALAVTHLGLGLSALTEQQLASGLPPPGLVRVHLAHAGLDQARRSEDARTQHRCGRALIVADAEDRLRQGGPTLPRKVERRCGMRHSAERGDRHDAGDREGGSTASERCAHPSLR
jgi:hypothetical protein